MADTATVPDTGRYSEVPPAVSDSYPEYLDGPALYKWLAGRGCPPPIRERISHWRDPDRRVSVYTADPHLVDMGIHLHEIPDRLWIDPPQPRRIQAGLRRAMLAARARGDTPTEIAHRFRVSTKTAANITKARERVYDAKRLAQYLVREYPDNRFLRRRCNEWMQQKTTRALTVQTVFENLGMPVPEIPPEMEA